MKRLLFTLLLLSLVSAQCVYYFYGEGCSHCENVKPLINELEAKGVEVHQFETWSDNDNRLAMHYLFDQHDVPIEQRGVPVAFTGDKFYLGDTPMLQNLEANLAECPVVPENISMNPAGAEQVSIWLLTGAAFVDSINPCAIAVLLILLAGLMATGDKKRALIAGLAFTLAIYIGYLLVGLGLYSAIQFAGLSALFYSLIGIIAILVGLANIKDYFWYGAGGFVMEIPRSWRPRVKKILDGVTNPIGAFIAGFLVLLFELPCTGGPYLFVLGLLADTTTRDAALPLLFYYNLVFVVPLLIITAFFYFGYKRIEEMQKWKDQNIRRLHLVAGLIMLALGIWVILGV